MLLATERTASSADHPFVNLGLNQGRPRSGNLDRVDLRPGVPGFSLTF